MRRMAIPVLAAAVLTGTALTGTVLTGTVLTGTVLTGTVLTGTALTGTALTGTALTGTALTGTALTGTALTGTALTGTALTGTVLAGTVPTGTVLTGTALAAVQAPAAAAAAGLAAQPTAVKPTLTGKQAQSQAQQPAVPGCTVPTGSRSPGSARPWAEQQLNFADAWQFTNGRGVTVAVVDSGVAAGSVQLGGRLTELTVTGSDARVDCVGHGTGVAGLIAAADEQNLGNPFFGVAPGADILSVKITDSDAAQGVQAASLAAGIRAAVASGAGVINVSVQTPDTPELRNAIMDAKQHNAVVVAAAGNDAAGQAPGPFFPAEYSADQANFPNVVSVGAIQQDGSLPNFADPNTHVSVVAPGMGVLTIAPDNTFQSQDGTSFAAPFVSGVAALVRASHPALTAAGVVRRIIATADGSTGTQTGAGMVDPLQAVTAVLPGDGQAVTPKPASQASPVAVPRAPSPDRFTRIMIVSVTGGALGAAALVAGGAIVVPAGRRRRWRPGRAAQPPAPEVPAADKWAS
jgi:membrane-anchored mycosin MYCP